MSGFINDNGICIYIDIPIPISATFHIEVVGYGSILEVSLKFSNYRRFITSSFLVDAKNGNRRRKSDSLIEEIKKESAETLIKHFWRYIGAI